MLDRLVFPAFAQAMGGAATETEIGATWSLVPALLAAAATITAALVATAVQVAMTRRRQRCQATLDYYTSLKYRHWKTQRMIDRRWPGHRPLTGDEAEALYSEQDDDRGQAESPERGRSLLGRRPARLKQRVKAYLNDLEYLAVGVHLRIFDIEVLDHIANSSIRTLYKQFEPYIGVVRSRRTNPRIYAELEKLVADLSEIAEKRKGKLLGRHRRV